MQLAEQFMLLPMAVHAVVLNYGAILLMRTMSRS